MNMIAYSQWLKIPYEIRTQIATLFDIPKSKYVHVFDNEVVEDGYTEKDLQNLTLEKIQKYLQSEETDFYKLLDLLVDRLSGKELALQADPMPELAVELPPEPKHEEPKVFMKRRGRPPKSYVQS